MSENSDDFQIFLPSQACRQRLHDWLGELTADHEKVTDLDTSVMQDQLKVCFEECCKVFLILSDGFGLKVKKLVNCVRNMMQITVTVSLCHYTAGKSLAY